ncbi:MAG: ATP-binding protein [Desulfobacterales bacterium]|jgi:anti-sigma regulatory factor (Ser/Thr protein kinase)
MLQIQRPAEKKSLDELLHFVSARAADRGFSPNRVREVELAVEESLVNILTYAYPQSSGDVQIRCENDEERLVLAIQDHGVPFDPLSLPVPDMLAELASRQVGGLGVFFVRTMTDLVEYRREGDCNVLTLTFGRTTPAAGG